MALANMIKKTARFVSLAGHPLVLGTLVILFQTTYAYTARHSVTGSVIVIGGITLPVIIWNVYKTYTGEYSGFDIPLRAQRRSFYTFLSCSFALVSALLFITRQPYPISISVGFCLLLVATCFVCNLRLKVSLHSAASFYLSFVLMYYNSRTGVFILAFAVLVALSRRILRLHTYSEIFIGTAIGITWGISFLIATHCLF